jgi:arylsulfatase A-like enzyme
VSNHPSAFWDYLATACHIVGIAPPASSDGISYLPTLLGEEQSEHEYLYWQFDGNNHDKEAVRADNWKAVRPATDAPVELYDLSVDIGEQHDVAAEHQDVVAKMKAFMQDAKTNK